MLIRNVDISWPSKDVGDQNVAAQLPELVTNCTQIVYVSIVGLVMLAALLEWFLWLRWDLENMTLNEKR